MEKVEKLEKNAKALQHQRSVLNNNLEKLFADINEKKVFKFNITDHALLRYLMRVELIPVSEAKYKILTLLEEFITQKNVDLNLLKNSRYDVIIDDVEYKINDRTIITIVTKK